jgi:oligosaccharide repeat unit polymerase
VETACPPHAMKKLGPFALAPTTLLSPKLAFAAFLVVFFVPALPILSAGHVLAIACGAAYFFLGAWTKRPASRVPWPPCRPNVALLVLIFAVKSYLLAELLEFDFSLANIVSALIVAGAAQKENVAGGILVNSVINLVFWHSLIGLCQRKRPWLALLLLVAFQVLSLQTGRFLFVSQVGLLAIVYHDIQHKTINGAALAIVVALTAALFPLLHAVRSGDIDSDVDVYSLDYIAEIMASDASPGRNFSELATYVDAAGYNYGKYLALAPLQFIPRSLWEDKPTTSLQADYSRDLFGLDYKDGVTFTFTIFDSYSFLGVVSLALVSFLWGKLFMYTYHAQLREKRPYMKIQLALLLVNSFNFFRGNVLDFLAPVLLSLTLAYVLDRLGSLRRRRRRIEPPGAPALAAP